MAIFRKKAAVSIALFPCENLVGKYYNYRKSNTIQGDAPYQFLWCLLAHSIQFITTFTEGQLFTNLFKLITQAIPSEELYFSMKTKDVHKLEVLKF